MFINKSLIAALDCGVGNFFDETPGSRRKPKTRIHNNLPYMLETTIIHEL